MKKLIYLFAVLFSLVGCSTGSEDTTTQQIEIPQRYWGDFEALNGKFAHIEKHSVTLELPNGAIKEITEGKTIINSGAYYRADLQNNKLLALYNVSDNMIAIIYGEIGNDEIAEYYTKQ